jgi:hypothetical protein
VPGLRTSTPAPMRRVALVIALAALATTAACGSGSTGTGSAGSTPTASEPLAPWQGTLTTDPLPPPVQSLRAVACATARRCWAVGSTSATSSGSFGPALVATTDGGTTWTVQPIPPTVGYLAGVACTSPRSCTAVGQVGQTGVGPGAVLTTADGGSSWVLQTVPTGTTDVTAVECRPAGRCTALGVVAGRVTTLSPTSSQGWVAGGALPAQAAVATALTCTDRTHCWATAAQPVDVGHAIGIIAETADGGTTWTLQPVPPGTGALQGIDCTPGRPSNAVSGSGSTTTPNPAGIGAICTAVGTTATAVGGARTGQGVVLTSPNGGGTWTSVPVTPTAADLLGVSCGAGPCVAVGTTLATAPEGGLVVLTSSTPASGATWHRAAVTSVALPLTGVACVSLSACVAVGESVSAHLTAG